MNIYDFSLILLMIFSLLSFVDGIVIHLFYYRLHEHPESRKEHYLHSLRALLFFLTVLLIYYFESTGFWLWIGCIIIIIDYIVESIDMFAEKESRRLMGGLSSFEYWLHGTLVMFRSLSLGLWFSDFSIYRDSAERKLSGVSLIAIKQIMISTLIVFFIHVLLILKPDLFSLFSRQCCRIGEER
nr:hypothetical protein BHI3_33360 [Bacteriovorax sp. HI3]